ncbi:lantibiotic dehydratase [Amycolatopsis aidingensis]|uniref:lantibiotic dehydratase n=1 Tax=Amycolatopsis aidingensis TaxID=2842453 RepID=UPI001C0C4FFD|nr:lantibiotic dehydratase [Amycolatopsis aidingensis]
MPEVGYRHRGTGVLRASAQQVTPAWWPALSDARDCRAWLGEVWPTVAVAVRHASPVLACGVEAILAGRPRSGRKVRRAALAVVRYVLRFQRSTPFGLFAGVAPLTVSSTSSVRFGQQHRPVARPDHRWLHQVINRLKACSELLAQLDVVFHDAVERQGERLVLAGPEVVSVRCTPAVRFVRRHAAGPVRVGVLAEALAAAFPGAGDAAVLVRSLLEHGFLVSSLRAPSTVTDPLGFLTDSLQALDTEGTAVASLVNELGEIRRALDGHNQHPCEQARTELAARMQAIAGVPRGVLSVDLRLDGQVRLPERVVREMERAADVLARVAREHTGSRAWREYFTAFCERFGTGTLVPLRLLVDPACGVGWPQGYPAGPAQGGRHVFSERDRLLLSWAAEATAGGRREFELDAGAVDALAAVGGNPEVAPPHVDLGARIHAASTAALDRGEFRLTVAPGRAAGTFSSRFTPLVPEAGLEAVFAGLPTITEGAVAAQVSCAPLYPGGENVARVPRCLPEIVSVGEHEPAAIGVDDLAITATRHRLHLVSLSRRRVVEPLVLHALAPKQQPPLARLLGELPGALGTGWLGFDWGPVAGSLPFLPRLRHGRVILAPAQWRLTRHELPADTAGRDRALARWQAAWGCPDRVQLRDFDQQLPLDLAVPAHREVLAHHLHGSEEAVLIESPEPGADGWLEGRPHLVVLPLASRRRPEPAPRVESLPVLTHQHGHPPGSAHSGWLYAKLYLPAHRVDRLLVHQLPDLLVELGERDWWFVRYPRTRDGDEPDHLRLRIRTTGDADKVLAALTTWADRLREDGLLSRGALDTYYPETGRYRAIHDAERLFAADSRLVLACLTHRPGGVSPVAATGLSLFELAAAFLGDRQHAADWLHHRAPRAVPGRAAVDQVIRLARGWPDTAEPAEVAAAHRDHGEAVRRYRHALPADTDLDACLHALLHMHHNRALGVDPELEAVCLRLARQAATTWHTTHPGRSS